MKQALMPLLLGLAMGAAGSAAAQGWPVYGGDTGNTRYSPAAQVTTANVKNLKVQWALQLGTLRFGVAYRLTPRTNFNLSVGVGVTDDTPDLELTLRVPMTF